MKNHKTAGIAILLAAALALMATAYSAYKGHANDADVNAIIAAYPALKNTATDSCATCHKSGTVPDTEKPQAVRYENNCGYCHSVYVRKKRDIKETLNRYGTAYLAAGRGIEAVKALAGKDSDGDGFTNDSEFLKATNPGNPPAIRPLQSPLPGSSPPPKSGICRPLSMLLYS